MICHIVAAAQNHTIGNNGALPWNISEDMKFFREQTANHVVVMGRKTYESMGKPLPNRFNIVVTRQADFSADGAEVVDSIEAAMILAKEKASEWGNEIYVIGGEEIYRQTVGEVDTIFLTRIHVDYEGDALYPPVDLEYFKETDRDVRAEEIPFTFVTYKRK